MRTWLCAGALLLLAGCAVPIGRPAPQEGVYPPPAREWEIGQVRQQGIFSVMFLDEFQTYGGPNSPAPGSVDRYHWMPGLSGGGQMRLFGEQELALGVEGFFQMGARASSNETFFSIDLDLIVMALYGGPFASYALGDNLRVYGAAGPTGQFVLNNQTDGFIQAKGSGFGTGYYARIGVEHRISVGTWIGLAARYWDSSTHLNHGMGDLKMRGPEYSFTVSRLF